MYKDVKLCLEEAQALGVPMWVASAVRQLWLLAAREIGPESDFTHASCEVRREVGRRRGQSGKQAILQAPKLASDTRRMHS